MNYQVIYHQYYGTKIDKEKMVVIAESLQDINDFRTKGKKSYAQIILYEQALGIDARKFSEVPEGWSFYGFWGGAYAKCIDLVYTFTTGQSRLWIDQCKTDISQYMPDFPRKYTDRVKVRNTKGSYIVGDYVTAEDGKQVWDSTNPTKRLYWQEDGLWNQITVHGDQAMLLDKDDLIAYAESLQ